MMSESEHLSGENRMFSATHSDKRMARVTGFFNNGINAAFTPYKPKTGRTNIERRNWSGFLVQRRLAVSKQNYSFMASLARKRGIIAK